MNKFIRKLIYLKNSFNNNKIVKINKIKLDISDDIFSQKHRYDILSGGYERHPIRILKRTINKNDIFLECGSGIGFISLNICKYLNYKKIFLIEANPKLVNIAKKNFKLNNIYPLIFNKAIHHKSGLKLKFYSKNKDFLTSYNYHEYSNEYKDDSFVVETITIDSIIMQNEINYLFLNIEGGEYNCLMNSSLKNINKLLILYDLKKTTDELKKKLENKLSSVGLVPRIFLRDRLVYYEKINLG